MRLNFRKSLVVVAAMLSGWAFFSSCDRDIEPKPDFPEANFFSPQYVQTGDTLVIVGKNLQGATAFINGASVSTKVNAEGTQLVADISSSVSTGTVSVTLPDGKSVSFTEKLVVNGTRPAYHRLLLGDFDGNGIRPAKATTDFGTTQWGINSSAAAQTGIGTGFGGVASSPAGGNYSYMKGPASGILPQTEGFVATLDTRNEITNDGLVFASNYFEYPGSVLPLPSSGSDNIGDYYIKFFVHFAKDTNSRVRVYIVDESFLKPDRYAYTIERKNYRVEANDGFCDAGIVNTNLFQNKWCEFVIPLSSMPNNYGFGDLPQSSLPYFKRFNKISIDVTDNFDGYDDLREDNNVSVYIDQVELIYAPSISSGADLLDTPESYMPTINASCSPVGPAWYQVY